MKNIIATSLILLSVATFYVYIGPQIDSVKELLKKEVQYTEAINQSEELVTIRDNFSDKYKKISEADIIKLKKILPDSVDNVKLVSDINGIALRHGMMIRNITLAEPSPDPAVDPSVSVVPFNTMVITFSVESTYSNFSGFLKDLETSLRLADVVGLDVRSMEDGVNKFDISMTTYWAK